MLQFSLVMFKVAEIASRPLLIMTISAAADLRSKGGNACVCDTDTSEHVHAKYGTNIVDRFLARQRPTAVYACIIDKCVKCADYTLQSLSGNPYAVFVADVEQQAICVDSLSAQCCRRRVAFLVSAAQPDDKTTEAELSRNLLLGAFFCPR